MRMLPLGCDLTLNVGTLGTQSTGSDGNITANGLQLLGTGKFELQNLTNNINTIAGATGGQIRYTDADNLAIGIVSSSLNASSSGIVAPGQLVSLTSVAGSLTDGNGSAMNVIAGSLALRAITGIGSGNAIETSVSQLAARNTSTGSIQIDNTSTQLTIETVDGIHGISKSGTGSDPGNIVVSNNNSITVSGISSSTNAPITNSTGGNITLTATGGASDITINSPLAASGGNGNITLTAGHNLVVNDTGVTNDISLVGTGTAYLTAASQLTLGSQNPNATPGSAPPPDANSVIVKTATGTITNTLPLVYNIQAPQISATGEVVLSGDFGRPGEHNITITAYWGDGSSTTKTFADPGHFTFSHFYRGNPDKNDTSAPILINVQVTHDPHVVLNAMNVNTQANDQFVDNPALLTQASPTPPAPFINADLSGAIYNPSDPTYSSLHGANTKIVSAPGSESNPGNVAYQDITVRAMTVSVPGEGLSTFPFDVTPPVVYLHFPEQIVVIDHLGIAPLQLSQQDTLRLDLTGAEDAVAAERCVFLEILRADGSIEKIKLPEHVLDHLLETVSELPDGRYRFLLLEPGESRQRLLLDEFEVRQGKIVDDNDRDEGSRSSGIRPMNPVKVGEDDPADADEAIRNAPRPMPVPPMPVSLNIRAQEIIVPGETGIPGEADIFGEATVVQTVAQTNEDDSESASLWNGWSSMSARRAWKHAERLTGEFVEQHPRDLGDLHSQGSAEATEEADALEVAEATGTSGGEMTLANAGAVALVGATIAGISGSKSLEGQRAVQAVATRLGRAARLFRRFGVKSK